VGPSSAGVGISDGVNKSENEDTMDEQRKHAILFAATLLCARKLMPLMEDNPDTSKELLTEHYRWRAVEQAHRLLEIIDKRWPAEKASEARR
jgi:hypothetical protein